MKKGFNLLKAQPEPPSAWTEIYKWVLGTARIVIIITEIIVLIAFGIRIFIDLQSKELDSKIQQSEAVLTVLKSSETKYRLVQNKSAAYSAIWNATPDYTEIIKSINAALPINTSITNLSITIDKDILTISGVADKKREYDVISLETNLKNNLPFLTNSVLEKLQDTSEQLRFSFRATIVNIQNKNLSDVLNAN